MGITTGVLSAEHRRGGTVRYHCQRVSTATLTPLSLRYLTLEPRATTLPPHSPLPSVFLRRRRRCRQQMTPPRNSCPTPPSTTPDRASKPLSLSLFLSLSSAYTHPQRCARPPTDSTTHRQQGQATNAPAAQARVLARSALLPCASWKLAAPQAAGVSAPKGAFARWGAGAWVGARSAPNWPGRKGKRPTMGLYGPPAVPLRGGLACMMLNLMLGTHRADSREALSAHRMARSGRLAAQMGP